MWWQYAIGVAITVGLVFLYAYATHANNHTEKPEGCEEELDCAGCKVSECSHRQT